MTEQHQMAEHTIVFERELDAPRELVWKVWTDPDEVTQWWGPEHFTTPREKIEFDLRPGGVCRLTMVGPDGEEYPSDGHFGIVEPPARLSFGETSSDHPMIESGETTVELVDLGEDRTEGGHHLAHDLRRGARRHVAVRLEQPARQARGAACRSSRCVTPPRRT
jgi:uncharacterized protein YndB with AHSA1/START domain